MARLMPSLLESLIDSLFDGVLVCDAQGLLVIANDAARRLFGAQYAVGRSLFGPRAPTMRARTLAGQLVPPDQLPLRRAFRGERIFDLRLVIQPGLGRWRYLSVSAGPVGRERGLGAVAVIRELRRDRAFQAATTTGRESLDATAHRLRTALHAISGAVALLDRELADVKRPSADQLLGVARRNAAEVARTIDDDLRTLQ
jgi:two-component system phosphate regulon sensor histidine kinase PhoR